MNLPTKVKIREVGPRDGFQSWPEFVPTARKLEIIEVMMDAGVAEMETTSFVSPKAIPQMRDAAEVMKDVRRGACRHTALVPNAKGAELAIKAETEGLVLVISVSERHNKENVNRSVSESVEDMKRIMQIAGERNVPVTGALATAFGCPYEGDVPEEDVMRLADAFIQAGAASVILADTTGMATPHRVDQLVRLYRDRYPDTPFSLHFHNNRGTAMANLLAALMAGADTFDTALGGIGGCPNVPKAAGNLPTEDVVYMLEDMGIDTGIHLNKIIDAACRLEKILGRTLPGQVMKSGPRDPEQAARVCRL